MDLETRKNCLRKTLLKYCKQIARERLLNNLYDLTPESCIEIILSITSITQHYAHRQLFFKLRKKFQIVTKEWLEKFIKLNGLLHMLSLIDDLLKLKLNSFMSTLKIIECVECIKEIMNKKFGMDAINDLILDDLKYISLLTKVFFETPPIVKKELLLIFTCLSVYSADGYLCCQTFLQSLKTAYKLKSKYSYVINQIRDNKVDLSYTLVLLSFVNSILIGTIELSERIDIRNELNELKFDEIVDELSLTCLAHADLAIQIDLYKRQAQIDINDFMRNNHPSLNSKRDLFNAICLKIEKNSNISKNFIDILQNIYRIDEVNDDAARVWMIILDATNRIVNKLHANKSIQTEIEKTDPLVLLPQIKSSCSAVLPPPPPPPPPPILSSLFPTTITIVPPPPPPPLPFMSLSTTGIPPPPPMINNAQDPNNNLIETNVLHSIVPKANKQLKSLNWDKIPDYCINPNNSNLWKEINRQDSIKLKNINYERLEELFEKNQIRACPSIFDKISIQNTGAKQNDTNKSFLIRETIELLDSKRILNINVFLKSISLSIDDFMSLIRDGKYKEIGHDTLAGLFKNLPDTQEIEKIKSFCESNPDAKLNKSENFIKNLIDTPMCELRVKIMLFLEEFDQNWSKINELIKKTIKCGQILLNSESLKAFMQIILIAGNYLNMNTHYRAQGFKVSFLSKLSDIKTNKPNVSLLHVVFDEFMNDFDCDNSFVKELRDLDAILNYGIANLKSELISLKSKTNELNKRCCECTLSDIRMQFNEKLEKCREHIEKADMNLKQINILEKELIMYYCEDQNTFKLDDFLRIFLNLCANMRNLALEKKRLQELEEKTLKRKQELETRASFVQKSTRQSANVDESSGMKDFLNALKSGNQQEILRKRQPARRVGVFERELNSRS